MFLLVLASVANVLDHWHKGCAELALHFVDSRETDLSQRLESSVVLHAPFEFLAGSVGHHAEVLFWHSAFFAYQSHLSFVER